MKTRTAWLVRLSAALLSLTVVGAARAQAPANPGRQIEGQILNNVGNAVTGQPAPVAPVQPGGYGVPATPAQALQGIQRQTINNATSAVTGQPMTTQAASAVRYQLPPQYAASAPGTTVSYGGRSYIVNADRTMSPVAAAVPPSPPAARYLIPAELAGNRAGTTVSYGGANYLINNDNTMSPRGR